MGFEKIPVLEFSCRPIITNVAQYLGNLYIVLNPRGANNIERLRFPIGSGNGDGLAVVQELLPRQAVKRLAIFKNWLWRIFLDIWRRVHFRKLFQSPLIEPCTLPRWTQIGPIRTLNPRVLLCKDI